MPSSPQFVVVELRVDASNAQSGAAQYSAALDKAQSAAEALTDSSTKAQLAITKQSQAMVDARAANDNLADGFRAANDNLQDFGKSLAARAIDFLNNVNHLKLLALAAYALSPAFRSFTNTEISAGLQLIGVHADVLAKAFQGLVNIAAPALSFFARIAIPITIIVAAWKALNYVVDQGAELLQKYGNAGRELFSDDVADNLTKLTKFQQDTISPQQVQYATELATRLTEAKKTIDDFLKVQLDVTDAALRLQAVWVNIVEAVATGVSYISNVMTSITSAAQTIGNLPIWKFMTGGFAPPGGLNPNSIIQGSQTADNSGALALARQRLAAGLGTANIGNSDSNAPIGGSFAARFSQEIHDLANQPKDDKGAGSNTYDRAIQSVKDQIDLLNLEAQGAGKTSTAYQELKVAHELNLAAMRAGITPTDEMREEWKKYADQIAAATIALNQAKVLQQEQFRGATQFLSPGQQAAANAAHQIDPTDWVSHLNDAGPRLAAFNEDLRQSADLSYNFLDTFNQGLLQGKSATESLQNALKGLESQLLQMAEKQAINSLFANLFKLLAPSGSGVLSGGLPLGSGGIGHAALGKVFDPAGVVPFASGGIVSSPTMFRFANGTGLMGEAGPEAIMPLARASNGALGVRGGGVQVNVSVVNQNGSNVQMQRSNDSDGNVNLRFLVRDAVNQNLAGGSHDSVLRSRFGMRPNKVRAG